MSGPSAAANLLKKMVIYKIDRWGGGSKNRSLGNYQIVLKEITEFFAFYMKTMLSVETCVISYLSGHVLGSPETLLQGRDQVPHRHDEARLHRRVRGCR